MKSLLSITKQVVTDVAMMCDANPTRDLITITRRVEHEGDSFLCITLPSFCTAFERALDSGCVSPNDFPSFRKRRSSSLPAFLSGLTELVFQADGRLLDEPNITAIRGIRQICLVHKKTLRPCNKERNGAAVRKFVEIENGIQKPCPLNGLVRVFQDTCKIVWSDMLAGIAFGDPYEHFKPRHGSGTTAESLRGNRKYSFPSWPKRLDRSFPYSDFAVASVRNDFALERISSALYPVARGETPVKVALVPKTLKTPRVIAVEPVCMQYTQQAVADWVRNRIETLSRFTKGRVFFRDQKVNANLALLGSAGGGFATIDMSEASDRVSCYHVAQMLSSVPIFRRYVFDTRSTRALLPGGDIITLKKFASMGSALCFPMEAMVFYCAIVAIRVWRAGIRPSVRSVSLMSDRVHVYGDDIIVPDDEASSVCESLEALGFRVNANKSFWTGKFRESCGTDAYDGEVVTPIYCRRDIPTDRSDVDGVVSSVSFANQLYAGGYWGTARLIREAIERLFGPLPSITETMQAIGWHSYSNAVSHNGWDKNLQRLKLRCWTPVPVMQDDQLNDDPALLKCFRTIGVKDAFGVLTIGSEHLLRSERYGNLALKRRWI